MINEVRRLLPVGREFLPTSRERFVDRGYNRALNRAFNMSSSDIITEVTASGLKGRGGASFPTGLKWSGVSKESSSVKYVVMNADESELGTFKDRTLLTEDPFGPLVGLLIAAHAVGARKAFCYIRGEYRDVEKTMGLALETLEREGWMDARQVEVEIRRGAGAYIAGEETALLNSIEGRRPEPRVKPPFPTQNGLWGAPTLIQNVETLANIAILFAHDVQWFKQYGTKAMPGTKLVALSGHVARPGTYEVPFGTSLQDIIHSPNLGGPLAGNGRLGAVLMGGAAGTFLFPQDLDSLRLDPASMAEVGASIGSGAIMVFDDSVDVTWILTKLARFFAEESCGQCVPCRIGTQRILEVLEAGEGWNRLKDLQELGQAMRDASICGLGQTAPLALLSVLGRPGTVHSA